MPGALVQGSCCCSTSETRLARAVVICLVVDAACPWAEDVKPLPTGVHICVNLAHLPQEKGHRDEGLARRLHERRVEAAAHRQLLRLHRARGLRQRCHLAPGSVVSTTASPPDSPHSTAITRSVHACNKGRNLKLPLVQ